MNETDRLRLEAQRACEAEDVMRMLSASDELLRRDSNDVDAMFIAGTAFLKAGQEGMATILLNAARCATKEPIKLGAIWNNIGCALQEYQPAEAYAAFKRSLAYGAAPGSTYDNLCNVSSQIGKHEEALMWADKSKAIDPSYNRSFALMHLGRWAEAWSEYAKTAGTPTRPKTDRNYGLPRWDGVSPGRVIVHGEQGIGDEIMFMSMLPPDFDGVIDCNPRTAVLFRRSFPKAKVYGTLLQNMLEWPAVEKCDWHIEMGGLGEFYAPSPFRRGAFLKADARLREMYGAWLGAGRLRVGLAWTGGTWATGRQKRSVPFDLIARLIEAFPEITFVNLEYEDRSEDLTAHPQVLSPTWATKKGADYDQLAALVDSLDLVISVTTSVVDLAGALGVPVWVLADENPQWRYSHEAGAEKMWFYESARVFRKQMRDHGRWDRVIGEVGRALSELTGAKVAAE
jgi:hypothetical protein